MQIAPPFGYKEVVPFLKNQKVRLLAPGEVPEFVQNGNAIPISLTEFQPVLHDYPIVFTGAENTQSFAPVAVLGLAQGENLFYQDGKWANGIYVPAYARRYPFCMARVNLNKVEQKDRLIRVEEKKLEDLNAAQLKNLMHKGILARVYMHLLSLENFGRLLDRRSGRKPN